MGSTVDRVIWRAVPMGLAGGDTNRFYVIIIVELSKVGLDKVLPWKRERERACRSNLNMRESSASRQECL